MKKLVQDYFCAVEDADDFESDDDDRDGGADESGQSDGDDVDFGMDAARMQALGDEEMSETEVNMHQCRVNEASDLLMPVSADYVNNSIEKETAVVKEFTCGCKLNSGQPCYSQFHHEEVIRRCMSMQELSNGMCNISHRPKLHNYLIT